MDAVYIGVAAVFFLMTWGLMSLCDRLRDHRQGGKP